jgi:8-oxo-dGTP pyrophosphatase MutT (NUDIX family)
MTSGPDTWTRISSRETDDFGVFRVRRDTCRNVDTGRTAEFSVIELPDWTNVVALTAHGDVVMIEQFRHGLDETILEIPGGVVDDGEDHLAAAKRELLEETGYTAARWKLIGRSQPNPAFQNNRIYHYLATGCERTREPRMDENESIVTRLMPLDTVEQKLLDGSIAHSLAVAAFYYFDKHRTKNENTTS